MPLEGVFLVLLSLLFVGDFPDALLVKELLVTFFEEFKLRLILKYIQYMYVY